MRLQRYRIFCLKIQEITNHDVKAVEYFIRDFSLASIHLFIGVIGLLFSLSYSIYNLTETLSTGIARPGGTILLNGIFWIISIQLLFSFINYDMNNKILITLKDKLF